ncbi:serine hydrolase domain-containing protein [Lacticaseibacillus yichunensis]|uniref:Serine hydrolase domain-containing protein n=1 Tax=Lacticaseibacillus yichunensis TaxID=2486015 RepID=A0ABW4CN85_9LACO|nr:serine hydrolase domain-containing protein [Lacticaseibacillus yichunensis]
MSETDDAITQLITDHIVPGASWAILTPGNVATHVAGAAQVLPTREPLRPNMAYDLASLTKVLGTTTVFLQAVEEKRVMPDAALADFIPGFHQPTTFRQALTHTSGLEGYIPHRDSLPAKALKAALIEAMQVTDECDQQVVYRDVNLLLVGWALETIYGAPIQDLITTRVLKPLGLSGASFHPDPAQCVPTSYDDTTQQARRGLVHDPKSAILGTHSGAAGLFATLADLVRFSEFVFGIRQAAAFPAHAYRDLVRDQTKNGLGRTLGWDLRQGAGALWLYHTGYTGMFWLLQPQLQRGLIVLTNRVHPRVNLDFLARRDEIVAGFLASASSPA